jgi:quinol monooxygenase YgiN
MGSLKLKTSFNELLFGARLHKIILIIMTSFNYSATAQQATKYVRIAKIVVDSMQLENYKAALKEEMEEAVRLEPGVLSLSGVYDKNNPTHVTMFEVYASEEAYQSHIQSPHFKNIKSL